MSGCECYLNEGFLSGTPQHAHVLGGMLLIKAGAAKSCWQGCFADLVLMSCTIQLFATAIATTAGVRIN
jgi:hypothetical protein